MKELVVYYSRKGYAEKIALDRARRDGADFLCVETIENTAGWYGFVNCMRMGITGGRPELFPYDTDVASYDKIVVVSPVWCGNAASPMLTFLEREKHNIKRVEYCFLYFLGSPTAALADSLDKLLRLSSHDGARFVRCRFGKFTYPDGEEERAGTEENGDAAG